MKKLIFHWKVERPTKTAHHDLIFWRIAKDQSCEKVLFQTKYPRKKDEEYVGRLQGKKHARKKSMAIQFGYGILFRTQVTIVVATNKEASPF
ncbi:MAG TPA: hypothetical protein DCE42_19000 [Myxococcales bacterium]|nr:hypothetical protein [Deltaproteobacteria bacterium]HAA56863.1 hypothetical protein [Myxococcales bacterium]